MNRKITPKQYAILLYEETKPLRREDIPKKTKEFFKLLLKNNNLGQTERIIKEFEKYYREKEGIREVKLTSAKELGSSTKSQIKGIFGKAELKEEICPEILGGVILRSGDWMIDGSVRKRLADLKNKLK